MPTFENQHILVLICNGRENGRVFDIERDYQGEGLRILQRKEFTPSHDFLYEHYMIRRGNPQKNPDPFLMLNGSVIAWLVSGVNAITRAKKVNASREFVYSSPGPHSARRETELWFGIKPKNSSKAE